ncbi:MAG: AAA family ATPase, partial [Desulfamplus sp.]|nr:AAA family ATPase [Desulfamplus sp.]
NGCIEGFLLYYRDYNLPDVKVDKNNAISSIKSLINAVRMTPYPVYLLIDEYDNFANTVMMGIHRDKDRYNALVHDEGILRTLFKAVKSSTSGSGFDRVFITGVSPVVMSDITSGYNIAKDIYFKKQLNDICGFREDEVISALGDIVEECGLKSGETNDVETNDAETNDAETNDVETNDAETNDAETNDVETNDVETNDAAEKALGMMKTYYNGYCFVPRLNQYIYNPTLCLYFFDHFQEMCDYPRKMLDSNLATDESKLEYIADIPMGREIIISMMESDNYLEVEYLSDRFGIKEMLDANFKNNMFIVSFLYYFGVLTLAGETDEGELRLKVPNLVMQGLYVGRVQKMLLPEPQERDDGIRAAKQVYQKGEMEPLCDFIESRYFRVFRNRDYRWANELTLKTTFLTLLYNDILYIMDSEIELQRRYADLTMIIRPDQRRLKIFDVLIEFKFVTLKDAGLTGDAAKELSKESLHELPPIKKALEEGEKQVIQYGKHLDEKYGNLRLQKFVVAALGFERVCFRKIN